eukprot:m.24288 g.24288  ORF g.24288 m.24288 type:complete len:189 (+) comp13041_c0_seq1:119-685(+)
MASLEAWVKEVGDSNGIDASSAVELLQNNQITLQLVGKLSDADWKELIPQVGLRAALRKEAAHLEANDDDSLEDIVSSLREEKEQLEEDEEHARQMHERYREQIQAAQSQLSNKQQQVLTASRGVDDIIASTHDVEMSTSALKAELEATMKEKEELEAKKVVATKEKDQAFLEANALSKMYGGPPLSA